MPQDVAIIGAGPAGLMAAETLAAAGAVVTVYDHMPSPARKFLIAGRGGLNLTHSEPLEQFLTRYGAAADWLAPAIRAFPPEALRQWCEGLGVPTFIGSSGRVFPKQMKAVTLLRAWLGRLESLGVQYRPRHRWEGWQDGALCFRDALGEAVMARPTVTILALGGASWPRLGSDGGWTAILEQAGVPVAPWQPANCGFVTAWSEHLRERFAGQPLKPVAVTHQGVCRQGEAMITARGLEGGVVYALSSAIREAIRAQGQTVIHLDLRPTLSQEALAAKLGTRKQHSLGSHLRKFGFAPLAVALLHEAFPKAALAEATAETLADWLKSLPLTLTGPTGLDRAISSAGGIPRDQMTEDFMLRALPNVYAIGEMLDWEAPTGGYLLQACFSTAVAAAHAIVKPRRS